MDARGTSRKPSSIHPSILIALHMRAGQTWREDEDWDLPLSPSRSPFKLGIGESLVKLLIEQQ